MLSSLNRARVSAQETLQVIKNDRGLLLLHLGTATGLLGFCMTDPIPLRTCSIISSTASIAFALTRNPILSYAPVAWSSLFIAVNSFKIGQILFSRMDTTLSELEEEVYTKHFMPFGVRPRQFRRLVNAATMHTYEPDSLIEKEIMFPSKTSVKLLMQGEATVYKEGKSLYTIDANFPICFIGDLSLLELEDSVVRLKPFISSVRAGSNSSVITLEWDHDYLLKILGEKSELSTQLRSVLTNSVIQKLIDMDQTNSKTKYINLLEAFAVDGVIDRLEKGVLNEYRKNHNIDDSTHRKGLAAIGWTPEDFERGKKSSSVSFLKSLRDFRLKLTPNGGVPLTAEESKSEAKEQNTCKEP